MISRAKKYVAVLLVFVCVCMIFSSLTAYIADKTVRSMKLSKSVSLHHGWLYDNQEIRTGGITGKQIFQSLP